MSTAQIIITGLQLLNLVLILATVRNTLRVDRQLEDNIRATKAQIALLEQQLGTRGPR